jgi:hypothetical protein
MDTDSKNHLPRVLVVAPNPDRQAFFITTLTPYFLVSVFRDVDQAIADCEHDPAPALIVDQNQPNDPNPGRFVENASRLKANCPA